MRYKWYMVFLVIVICHAGYSQSPKDYKKSLKKSEQCLLVTTRCDGCTRGRMALYSRKNKLSKWRRVDEFAVNVGRNGLSFNTTKKEGDGFSPSGSFTLGPLFSYYKLDDLKMPFKQVYVNDLCVDDINSKYYNTLIDADTIRNKDWNSNENMKRNDDLYEYGVWVNYNSDPVIKSAGSCIFLHVWKDENTPTSGCTAMSRENMLKIIYWLDADKNPMLIQTGPQLDKLTDNYK